MKRHPALRRLSRDHHRALVAARRLKRADESSAGEARDAFAAFWDVDGRHHFREEEEILLPACAELIDVERPRVARVLTDHVVIRHLADRVGAERPSVALLHELGRRLEPHVRCEERELFPQIERSMRDADLRELVKRLGG